ncbi:MAG TPA: hypothetical protein VE075_05150, partial [Thermoanaerobaculia bacterium]|nr:hypothetical protein [Thermoanaerobaculia bacterium]
MLLAFLIVLPYWKLATLSGVVVTDDVGASDLMNEGFPYRYAIGAALRHGELPTWLPDIYGGMPLLARAEGGVCYPPNLLLYGALPPYAALDLSILLTLFIAGAGMYLYARQIGAARAGGLIAGLSFSFSGFMVGHMKHLSMAATAAWLPVALWLLERALAEKDPRRQSTGFCGFGLVVGAQYLCGHFQIAYYATLLYVAYFIARLLSADVRRAVPDGALRPPRSLRLLRPLRPLRPLLRMTSWFTLALLGAVAVSAVQLLPTYELVGLTERAGGVAFEYASDHAYDLADLRTFIYPYANGDAGDGSYRGQGVFWEDEGYAGLLPLLLAAYACVRAWREWPVRFFLAALALAMLLVVGPHTPIHAAAFHLVPGMRYFRFPTRFLMVVDGSIAVLAAIGATRLLARSHRFNHGAAVAAVALELWFFQARQNPIAPMAQWQSPPATARLLHGDAGAFRIYSIGGRESHRAAFARAHGWESDLRPFIAQRDFLQPDSNVLYGIASADGYAQLTPSHVVDLWGDQNRFGLISRTMAIRGRRVTATASMLKILSLYNVKYLLSAWPVEADTLTALAPVGQVFVYRNPQALPRAFMVGRYRLAADRQDAARLLLAPDFDPREEAVLEERPAAVIGEPGRADVAIDSHGYTYVAARVTTRTAGLLVLSDTPYPGWQATVDGRMTRIYRANLSQRAVVVPAGSHEVRFEFRSATIRAGFWVSGGGLLLLLAAMVPWKRWLGALRPRA